MNTNIVTQRPAMVDAPPHVLARIMTVLMAAALAGGLLTTDAQARGGGGHGGGGGFGGGFAGGHGGGFVGGGLLPLAPALGSTGSAAVGTALFVGFPATMAESDFSRPCIIGYAPRLPDADRRRLPNGRSRDLPVPAQGASAHARVSDHAGSPGRSR